MRATSHVLCAGAFCVLINAAKGASRALLGRLMTCLGIGVSDAEGVGALPHAVKSKHSKRRIRFIRNKINGVKQSGKP